MWEFPRLLRVTEKFMETVTANFAENCPFFYEAQSTSNKLEIVKPAAKGIGRMVDIPYSLRCRMQEKARSVQAVLSRTTAYIPVKY